MVSVTVSIPEDIRKKMKEFPEINWSSLVRKTIINEVNKLKLKEDMVKELEKEKDFNDWAVKLVRKGRNEGSG